MSNKTLIRLEFFASVLINIPILFIQWFVSRGTHVEMMVLSKHMCKYGMYVNSYREFKRAFNNVDWGVSPYFQTSLFGADGEYGYNHLHADIFIIKGKGYILTPIGLMLANRLIRMRINEIKYNSPSVRKLQWAN